ncbi:MAG: bifunctional phosphoglucose/phosphomannose isomerase [Candidatus Margulisiibacteriota bacterium]
MSILDDIQKIKRVDPRGMSDLICSLPEMMKKALDLASAVKYDQGKQIKNIIFCGMGGSAISADIVLRLASNFLDVPVVVVRGYDLPNFAGKDTLVFILSYSGNTEETLSCYHAALSKGANIIAVTSGGQLEEQSIKNGHVLVKIPGDLPPRASMPYILVPVICALNELFPGHSLPEQVRESIFVLEGMKNTLGPEKLSPENPAKKTAEVLSGKFPFILGSEGGSDAAAYRWKCQLSENSKTNSCFNVFPELDHNEIVNLAGTGSKNIYIVFLRDKSESEKMKKRINVTKKIIEKSVGGTIEIYSKGESHLARMLSLCYFGDFVSLYLAVLNGFDPMPVKPIDELKEELSK